MENSFVDTLLELGIITKQQLETAITCQWENGGKLEESLISLGYFNEDTLLSLLERKFGYYSLKLNAVKIDPEATRLVPSWLVRRFFIVPLRQSKTSLACLMMNPLDREAMSQLKKAVYHDILPFIAKKSDIEHLISEHYGPKMPEEIMVPQYEKTKVKVPSLLKKYTFESFITGKCNDLAYSVSFSAARGYSEELNPLFIYSDVGMGKTHLLVAIWNYIIEHGRQRQVFFTSSESFVTALKEALETHRLTEFKEQYNKADVLLIDDIGLIAGDEVAQQHFFHIFNDLYQNSKQIVVTSDRLPKELPTLSDRLKSRFEGGLIAKIDPPDLEARTSILKSKAKDINIAPELISLIAREVSGNVRGLEGVLKEVIAYKKYKKEKLTKEIVEDILIRRSVIKPYT